MTWARPSEAERRREREQEKNRNMRNLLESLPVARRGTYAGGTSGEPAVKSEPYRDPVLLEMARGRPCLLMVPAVCNHRLDTTVAAHSNSQEHGKGMGRKADDCYVVEACSACHYWIDFGKASAESKEAVFMNGHALQVLAWRLRVTDPSEPDRFRRAARRVLERLNATPIGDMP